MKRSHLIAVLVGFMAIVAFANTASAYYHPGLGRFTSRDPGPARVGSGGMGAGGQFVQRDPANEYASGMNLYEYCGSNPAGYADPEGTDFIAVADRRVEMGMVNPGLWYHYSLEYWTSPCDVKLNEQWDKPDFEKKYPGSKQAEGVELLREGDWRAYQWNGKKWKETGVAVSVIHYSARGNNLMAIYQGTPEEVKKKWEEVTTSAKTYQYAEQNGFNGTFVNWPNSIYSAGNDVNNSNTFVRWLVSQINLTMSEMKGYHPGRNAPQAVTDKYSTPWKKGTAAPAMPPNP